MILRKFKQHIQSENWFAVSVDFLVVVVGIFVGLQVEGWNQDRKDAIEEQESLLRLQGETEQVVVYWERYVQAWGDNITSHKIFLTALDAKTQVVEDVNNYEKSISTLLHYPAIHSPDTIYNELLSSGNLAKIKDIKVRNAFAKFKADVDFISGQLTQFRASIFPVVQSAFEGRIFSKLDKSKTNWKSVTFDFDALANDDKFVSAMVDGVRNQMQFQKYRVDLLRSALELCETTSTSVKMVCGVTVDEKTVFGERAIP